MHSKEVLIEFKEKHMEQVHDKSHQLPGYACFFWPEAAPHLLGEPLHEG